MDPHVSVIIPIYNTAPWLRRCLDSVCGQTLKELEIICVDDGSSDESADILREYARRDSRILPITFGKNQGVSIARNAGMAAANGQWLGFVDSDDSIAPDFYEKLYAAARAGTAEIVKGVRWSERNLPNPIDTEFNERIKKNKFFFTYEWQSAIYNTEFLRKNSIYFIPGCIRNQDVAFLYEAVICANQINIVNDAIYKYFYRSNSANTDLLSYKQIISIVQSRGKILDRINRNILDKDLFTTEYMKQILFCFYDFKRANTEESALIEKYISSSFFKFIDTCREKEKIMAGLEKFDNVLASFFMLRTVPL